VQQLTQHQPVTHQHHAPVQHIQVVQHFHGTAPQPSPTVGTPGPGTRLLQRAALQRMELLRRDRRLAVLNFMQREFGTRRVVELDATQCERLSRYVERVIENQGR